MTKKWSLKTGVLSSEVSFTNNNKESVYMLWSLSRGQSLRKDVNQDRLHCISLYRQVPVSPCFFAITFVCSEIYTSNLAQNPKFKVGKMSKNLALIV